MAISPMASRAMVLSYSRLDRLVRIDTLGCRTIVMLVTRVTGGGEASAVGTEWRSVRWLRGRWR